MKGPSAIKIYDCFDRIFLKYQCGFRKDSSQHLLLYMIEKIKQARDNNNVFTAILTDLSMFDRINHKLLIAISNACGFNSPLLKFISAYLNLRKQKTKVGSTFSDYLNILFGVLQGSLPEPLLSMFTHAICFSKLILLNTSKYDLFLSPFSKEMI